jgi:hypothetical protein
LSEYDHVVAVVPIRVSGKVTAASAAGAVTVAAPPPTTMAATATAVMRAKRGARRVTFVLFTEVHSWFMPAAAGDSVARVMRSNDA